MRWRRWGSAVAWVFSWRVIYLEIFRWRHMTPTLRFNAPPPPPGVDRQPKPGLPLIAMHLRRCVTDCLCGNSDRWSAVVTRDATGHTAHSTCLHSSVLS